MAIIRVHNPDDQANQLPCPEEGGDLLLGSPEQALELHEWMTANLDAYLQDLPNTQFGSRLYPRQIESLQKHHRFMERANQRNSLTKIGYSDLTVGFGKSWLIAAFLEGTGIGQLLPPALSAEGRPLQGLVVAPTQVTLKSLWNLLSSAQAFTVTQWFDRTQDDSGDVIVMSDNAFRRSAIKRPLIISDESHTKLGHVISETVAKRSPRIVHFAFSGTVDYHPAKRSTHVFGQEIDSYPTLQAIEDGYHRPIQIFALDIDLPPPDQKSVPLDTRLRKDPAFNELILEIVQTCVEDGMQVLVRCINGDQCDHSEKLTQAATSLEIFDQGLGETRPVRAAAVHGYKGTYRGSEKNRQALQDYEDGKLDVLFHHGMIGMGMHSRRTNCVINMPSESLVVVGQHLGRTLFPGEEGIACIFDLCNPAARHKQSLTAQALGLEHFESGMIIGPKPDGRGPPHDPLPPVRRGMRLPPSLKARSDSFNGRLVSHRFVGPKKAERVPEGLTPITESPLYAIVPDEQWLNTIADAYGIDRKYYNNHWHVATDDLAALSSDEIDLPHFLTATRIPLTEAADRLNIPLKELQQYITDFHVVTITVPNPAAAGDSIVTIPEPQLLLLNPPYIPRCDPSVDVAAPELQAQLQLKPAQIRYYGTIRTIDGIPQPIHLYNRASDNGAVVYLNGLDALTIKHAFQRNIPPDAVRLSALRLASGGLAHPLILKKLRRHGRLDRHIKTAHVRTVNDEPGYFIRYLEKDIGRAALAVFRPPTGSETDTSRPSPVLPPPIAPDIPSVAEITPRHRDRSKLDAFPLLNLSTLEGERLTIPEIADLTGKTVDDIKAIIGSLPPSPNIRKIVTKDHRETRQLKGEGLESTLIRLGMLRLADAASRLQLPLPMVEQELKKISPVRRRAEPIGLHEWHRLLAALPLPLPGWQPIRQSAEMAGLVVSAAADFVTRFGGLIRQYYMSDGQQEGYISSFYHMLLQAQASPERYPPPPANLPHNWLTIRERTRSSTNEFNNWAAKQGVSFTQLFRTGRFDNHLGRHSVLPHFSENSVQLFEAQLRSRR